MKVQDEITKEEIKLREESLEDLSAADEQADEAKGGSPKLFLYCANGEHLKR